MPEGPSDEIILCNDDQPSLEKQQKQPEDVEMSEEDSLLTLLKVNGPSMVSCFFYLALCLWCQVVIPSQTPHSDCVFTNEVRDVFYGLLVFVTMASFIQTLMKNHVRSNHVNALRVEKGMEERCYYPWAIPLFILCIGTTTVLYGFSYKTIPIDIREGWVLRTCPAMEMAGFGISYASLVVCAFSPMYFL